MENEICNARPHPRWYFHLMMEVNEDVDVE